MHSISRSTYSKMAVDFVDSYRAFAFTVRGMLY